MKVIPLTPEYENKWNDYINSKDGVTIFHTLYWRDIICKTYGYTPKYYLGLDNNNSINGILPLFCIKSLFRKKWVSNPFSFYCEPLFEGSGSESTILSKAINYAKKEKIDYIHLKPVEKLNDKIIEEIKAEEDSPYITTKLKINKTCDELESKYNKKLKKNLRTLKRNIEKESIRIRFMKDKNDLKQFFSLMLKEYHNKHGIPCQPYGLLENMHSYLFKKGMMNLLVAEKNNKIIAGMLLLMFKKRIHYFIGSSDVNYKRFSLTTILADYAIKWASSKNFEIFDFGPSSPTQNSLIYFKERWGSYSKTLYHYFVPVSKTDFPKNINFENSHKGIRTIYKHIPLPIIKIFLPFIIKRFG